MKAQIKYSRVANLFGRTLVYAQLYTEDGEQILGDTTLAGVLQHAEDEGIEITNAHEILDLVCRQYGFGA